jgi:glutathione S-transferase
MGSANETDVARGQREFDQFARVLDDHLKSRTWITGSSLSLADFAIATPLMRMKEASIDLSPYPSAIAWFDRVQALDAWKRTQPSDR